MRSKRQNPPALSRRLKAAIEASDLTHNAIAVQAGVSNQMVSRFVKGERDLRLATAGKIAAVLKLELIRVDS